MASTEKLTAKEMDAQIGYGRKIDTEAILSKVKKPVIISEKKPGRKSKSVVQLIGENAENESINAPKVVQKEPANKKTVEYYVERLKKLNFENSEWILKVGKLLTEAKENLSKNEFTELLNNKVLVDLQRTQARKSMKYYECISKAEYFGESTLHLKELGIEKVLLILKVDLEKQLDLKDLIEKENLSVRELKKVVKKLKNNPELTPADAWNEVNNEPKDNKTVVKETVNENQETSNEVNDDYHKKYLDLQKEYDRLKAEHQQVLDENNRLKQILEKEAKDSDNA